MEICKMYGMHLLYPAAENILRGKKCDNACYLEIRNCTLVVESGKFSERWNVIIICTEYND